MKKLFRSLIAVVIMAVLVSACRSYAENYSEEDAAMDQVEEKF